MILYVYTVPLSASALKAHFWLAIKPVPYIVITEQLTQVSFPKRSCCSRREQNATDTEENWITYRLAAL